jgi:hypothetical protein
MKAGGTIMADMEKVIKEFEHLLNAAKGNYQDFVDLTVDGGEEILALLKKQEKKKFLLKNFQVILNFLKMNLRLI